MHIDDLRALAPMWLSKTEEVREDKSHWMTNITDDIYGKGWISEMYGYSFGAAEVDWFHFILFWFGSEFFLISISSSQNVLYLHIYGG